MRRFCKFPVSVCRVNSAVPTTTSAASCFFLFRQYTSASSPSSSSSASSSASSSSSTAFVRKRVQNEFLQACQQIINLGKRELAQEEKEEEKEEEEEQHENEISTISDATDQLHKKLRVGKKIDSDFSINCGVRNEMILRVARSLVVPSSSSSSSSSSLSIASSYCRDLDTFFLLCSVIADRLIVASTTTHVSTMQQNKREQQITYYSSYDKDSFCVASELLWLLHRCGAFDIEQASVFLQLYLVEIGRRLQLQLRQQHQNQGEQEQEQEQDLYRNYVSLLGGTKAVQKFAVVVSRHFLSKSKNNDNSSNSRRRKDEQEEEDASYYSSQNEGNRYNNKNKNSNKDNNSSTEVIVISPQLVVGIETVAKLLAVSLDLEQQQGSNHQSASRFESVRKDALLFAASLLRYDFPWNGKLLFSRFLICSCCVSSSGGIFKLKNEKEQEQQKNEIVTFVGGEDILDPKLDLKETSRLCFIIGASSLGNKSLLHGISKKLKSSCSSSENKKKSNKHELSINNNNPRDMVSIRKSYEIIKHAQRNRGLQHRHLVLKKVGVSSVLSWSDAKAKTHALVASADVGDEQEEAEDDDEQEEGNEYNVDQNSSSSRSSFSFPRLDQSRIVTTKQVEVRRANPTSASWGIRVSRDGILSVPVEYSRGNPFFESIVKPAKIAGCFLRLVAIDGHVTNSIKDVREQLSGVVKVRLTLCVITADG